jgi:hypothetical protein
VLLSGTMKNYVEYEMDFDVYYKKHISEAFLPEEEEKFDRKFEKKDFEKSTELIKELFCFKMQNDDTNKIKIVDKKLAMVYNLTEKMKKMDEFKELMKLIKNSYIDYNSKASEFANKLIIEFEKILKKPNYMLKNWSQELKLFPMYIGLDCDINVDIINGILFETRKHYSKEFKEFKKDFNILKEDKKRIKMDFFNYPESMHSTLLFFKTYNETESKIIENFRVNKEIKLNVTHFIYARGCILTFIVNKDEIFEEGVKKIKSPVQNNVQHITYAKGKGIKPFESNIILDQIFERLKKEKKEILDLEKVVKFDSISLSKKRKVGVYLVELPEKLEIVSFSKKYYRR